MELKVDTLAVQSSDLEDKVQDLDQKEDVPEQQQKESYSIAIGRKRR